MLKQTQLKKPSLDTDRKFIFCILIIITSQRLWSCWNWCNVKLIIGNNKDHWEIKLYSGGSISHIQERISLLFSQRYLWSWFTWKLSQGQVSRTTNLSLKMLTDSPLSTLCKIVVTGAGQTGGHWTLSLLVKEWRRQEVCLVEQVIRNFNCHLASSTGIWTWKPTLSLHRLISSWDK